MAVLGKGVYYDPQKDAYRVVLEGVVKTFNPRTLGVTKAEALRQANEHLNVLINVFKIGMKINTFLKTLFIINLKPEVLKLKEQKLQKLLKI